MKVNQNNRQNIMSFFKTAHFNTIIFLHSVCYSATTINCLQFIDVVFTFFQKKGRVGMIKKGTFVSQKGTLVR